MQDKDTKIDYMKALNEHFLYNHKLSKALQQLLPPAERKILQLWFDKLLEMNKTREQMIIRSDYMWFLLLMLQGKRIREPFSKLPPLKLPPLKHFVPLRIYEEVLIANEPNMIYRAQKPSDDSIFQTLQKTTTGTSCSSINQSH